MAKSFPAATAAHHAPVHSQGRTAASVRAWLDSCSRHQPLSQRTVLELARRNHRWQQHPAGPDHAPDPVRRRALRARDQLVRHNLRLISHTWGRHRSSLPPEDEGTADAFQEAAISLVRAAEKYDPSRGYCFSTYASFWVRRGFSEHERRGRRMIRLPHVKAALVLRAQRLAREQQTLTGSLLSLDWLAARCGARNTSVKTSQLQELLLIWWRTATAELDRPGGGAGDDGAGLALLERIADPNHRDTALDEPLIRAADFPDGPATYATYATCAIDGNDPEHSLLPLLLQRLSPVQRRLLWHRYLREHPLSTRQIEKVMGLTPSEQQRMEEEALALLRQGAREHGAL
jgi:RNA polymerase sigma factor (sigma-70 family)